MFYYKMRKIFLNMILWRLRWICGKINRLKHGIWISGGFEAKFEFLAKVKFEFWTSSRLSTIFGFGGFDGGLEGHGFGVTYGDFVVCKCWGMEGEFFGYFS